MILSRATWALADDFHATFTTETGRRVLRDLEAHAFMGGQSTTGDVIGDDGELVAVGPIDPYRLAVNEGRRQGYDRIRYMIALAGAPERQTREDLQTEQLPVNAWGDTA